MAKKIGKTEIIKRLSERIYGNVTDNEIQQCTRFCDTLVDIFAEALLDDEKILWKGFLSAETIERGQRRGRNPQTNEVVTYPPTKSIKCKISKTIRDMVNEK